LNFDIDNNNSNNNNNNNNNNNFNSNFSSNNNNNNNNFNSNNNNNNNKRGHEDIKKSENYNYEDIGEYISNSVGMEFNYDYDKSSEPSEPLSGELISELIIRKNLESYNFHNNNNNNNNNNKKLKVQR
jgi:hypothetical protein